MWQIDASTEGAIAVIAAWLRHVSSAFTMATYVALAGGRASRRSPEFAWAVTTQ